jgi:hypothetical protein
VASEPSPSGPKRVRREDGGELAQWPRGLVAYTPADGAPDTPPDPAENRTANRIDLAARLIALRRAAGADVGALLSELRGVERARRDGRADEARRRLEQLLGTLDGAAGEPGDRPLR